MASFGGRMRPLGIFSSVCKYRLICSLGLRNTPFKNRSTHICTTKPVECIDTGKNQNIGNNLQFSSWKDSIEFEIRCYIKNLRTRPLYGKKLNFSLFLFSVRYRAWDRMIKFSPSYPVLPGAVRKVATLKEPPCNPESVPQCHESRYS